VAAHFGGCAAGPRTLRLGTREWHHGSFGIMAVIDRTPDSFFALAVCAWLGARVFRVPAARAALTAVAELQAAT
jgi:hypothetical protein